MHSDKNSRNPLRDRNNSSDIPHGAPIGRGLRRAVTQCFAVFTLASCGAADSGRSASHAPATETGTGTAASPSSAPQAPGVSPRELAADTPMKSPSGATFEAPKGWLVTEQGDLITLDNPEHDLTLALVEVPNASGAEKAIEAAWTRVKPDFQRKPKETTHPPAKDGWDGVTQIVYETGGSEQRVVIALAQRKGSTEYVALIDGTEAGLDRRGAQLMTVISTFKAAGIEEESFKGRVAHPLDAERIKRLEAFITAGMDRAQVPGAAIAIVRGGKVIYDKGFGVRALGKKDAVTPDTLFLIGSTTKSLTTLMMGKLVDEGKFGWETPVKDVLPSFALADAEVTKKLQMKHTVCACAGLPRQDMEFFFTYANVTPENRVESMRAMTPTTGFGETFQYSNTMVAAGGYVAAHASAKDKKLGPAYDQAMDARIFGPLGMTRTTMDFARAMRGEHASPHGEDLRSDLKSFSITQEEGVISVRPAGAAWSNVRDMAKVVMLELAKGRDEKGNVVVSEANVLRRREPQIKITDKLSYGLGLFVESDHGVPVVHHGGNNLGFTSDMYFLPEHDIGVVMLTNAGGANAFRRSVRRRVFELLFDGKEEASKNLEFAVTRSREAAVAELSKVTLDPAIDELKSYVGSYKNADLGDITIGVSGKKGILDVGEWKSPFGKKKRDDGTESLVVLDPPLAGLEFRVQAKDGRMTLVLDASQKTYAFERRPAP